MKIIDKRAKTPKVKISEIPQGSCFLYNDSVYMKLDSHLYSSNRFLLISSDGSLSTCPEVFLRDKSFILNLLNTEAGSPKIDIVKSNIPVEPIDAKLQIEKR